MTARPRVASPLQAFQGPPDVIRTPPVSEDTVPFVGVGDNGKTRRNFLFRLVVNVAVIFTSTHTSVGIIALDESFTPDGVSKRIHVFGHRFPLGRLFGPEPLRHWIHVKRGMGGYIQGIIEHALIVQLLTQLSRRVGGVLSMLRGR